MKIDLKAAQHELGTLITADRDFWNSDASNDPSETIVTEVKNRNKRIEELEHAIAEGMEYEGMRVKSKTRADEFNAPVNRLEMQVKGKEEKAPETIGDLVINDAAFKAWLDTIAPNGSSPSRSKFGTSPAVDVKTLLTGTSSTSAGALVYPEQLGLREPGLFMRPLTIRDLITSGTTNSDAIEYVLMGATTNAAAPVAEATAASGGSGAKSESDMALSTATTSVKTIAHWIPATRRALADAGQLRTLIDSFLRYGLEEELEDQIVSGGGTGENFLGIISTPLVQTQAYATDIVTTARKARTLIKTVGRTDPTAYAMHPTDWETFDLAQDNEARYFFGGPSVLGNARLWGLPVVESEALTAGQAIIGDWKWAVLWQRMQAQILVSDSHSDFFIRNLIAILAEMRAAFAVIRPKAFCLIDLTA